MDKITTEQKAKAYDKALDRAKKWYNAPNIDKIPTYGNRIIEEIFPELTESEDEKIRKEIYWFLTQPDTVCDKRWIAWLEKQKAIDVLDAEEREFADNVDSYRKEVDAAYQEGYNEGVKATLERQGEQKPFDYEHANIQQKDFAPQEDKPRFNIGDVVCDKSCTTLNKDSQPNYEIVAIRNGLYICDKGSIPISYQDEYELVAKKIEAENETEIPFGAKDSELQEATYFIPKGFHAKIDDDKVVIKKGEKPITWSEEGASRLEEVICMIEANGRWVRSDDAVKSVLDWLKSLRPQKQWKPSDEQLDALQYVYRNCNPPLSDKLGWNSIKTLELMYQELKKLK